MKKLVIAFVVLSLVVLGNVFVVFADGPSGNYVSGVTCVNLTSTSANISIQVYSSADNGGTLLGAATDTIGGDSNKLYFTGSAGDKIGSLLGSGQGSAVVSSDQQIACSINTQTSGGTLRVGTSNGFDTSATASKVYVPQALRLYNGSSLTFASYVAIQNAGGSGTTTVTAKFYDSAGTEVTAAQQTFDIPPNSTHVFYQDTNTALGSAFNGSATFESSDGTPLAGTVVMFDDSSTLLTYDAFADGSTAIVGPRFVKNISGSNLFSGMACQNLSTSTSTDISATFSIFDQASSTTVTDTVTKSNVGPGQSFGLYAANFAGDSASATLNAITRGYGSVTVSSTGGVKIACNFNEDARTGTFAGKGSTYNGVPVANATNTVSFPQVVALGSSSYRGGFQYANTTSSSTTCSHTYSTPTDGVLGTISGIPLAGNGSNSIYAETEMAGSGIAAISSKASSFNGSVTVTCGQPIVGIYNMAALPLGGDTFVTNTGVNK